MSARRKSSRERWIELGPVYGSTECDREWREIPYTLSSDYAGAGLIAVANRAYIMELLPSLPLELWRWRFGAECLAISRAEVADEVRRSDWGRRRQIVTELHELWSMVEQLEAYPILCDHRHSELEWQCTVEAVELALAQLELPELCRDCEHEAGLAVLDHVSSSGLAHHGAGESLYVDPDDVRELLAERPELWSCDHAAQ